MDQDLRKQEQQQLSQILTETFQNKGYTDDDISHLINDSSGTYQMIFGKIKDRKLSVNSNLSQGSVNSSRKQSDSESQKNSGGNFSGEEEESPGKKFGDGEFSFQREDQIEQLDKKSRRTSEISLDDNFESSDQLNLPICYNNIEQYFKKYKEIHPISQVQQKYPAFIISQPSYTLQKSFQENTFQYNTLKNVNIEIIDVGYCAIAQNFRIAVGTDDGRVAVFQKTYTKPVNIFEAFSLKKNKNSKEEPESIKITGLKWSENMQYLAVSSSSNQLKVYQFKQSIAIQNKSILRLLKQPIQLISLSPKELKNKIISIKFISELPFLAILQDNNSEVHILEYRKKLMSYQPSLNKLPIRFNDITSVEVTQFTTPTRNSVQQTHKNYEKDQYSIKSTTSSQKIVTNSGSIIAVGTQQYVTIALLHPTFQVMMVYDKYKHGKNIKKQGHPHITFRNNPLGILIAWDKFAQILNINIQSLQPLQSQITSEGAQLLPESTLTCGLLTNTLVYQVSQSGIKIYPVSNFKPESQSSSYSPSIYHYPLNFFQLPHGLTLQQHLSVYNTPTLQSTEILSKIISVSNSFLFLSTNTSLFHVKINKFEQYVRNTIQNLNNWKMGLQIICDGYQGKFYCFDDMSQPTIQRCIQQYTSKYIYFLKMVISNDSESLLWTQQLTFLINLLIQTDQYTHIFNNILPKLISQNLQKYIHTLQPFILLHKIPQITTEGFNILLKYLPSQIISVLLIGNLDPQFNEIDLIHSINGPLLKANMLKEMVELNYRWMDWYTPLVVLISQIKRREADVSVQKKRPGVLNNENVEKQGSFQEQVSQKRQQGIELQKELENEQGCVSNQIVFLSQLLSYLTFKILHRINNPIPSFPPPKNFLSMLIPLLQSQITPIILHSPQTASTLFYNILPELFSNNCLNLLNSMNNKSFNSDLMTDIITSIPVQDISNTKMYWIEVIKLVNKGYIKLEVFMGIRQLISYQIMHFHSIGNKQVKQINKILEQIIQFSANKIQKQFSQLSHELLNEFFNELLSPKLYLTIGHIGLLQIVSVIVGNGYYLKVVHAILSTSCCTTRLFPYIEQTISKFDRQQLTQLKSIIYQNLQMFVRIDCNQLCNLLIEYYLQDIQRFAMYTPTNNTNNKNPIQSQSSEPPTSLLPLTQNLLHRFQSPQIQSLHLPQFQSSSPFILSLRLQYLKLLALTSNHHIILSQIKKQNYPLDPSIQICRKYGVIDAEAYLLVKSGGEGDIPQAISLYFKLIASKINTLNENNFNDFKIYFVSIIQQCIKICTGLHISQNHLNTQWFILALQLNNIKLQIYRILPAYVCDLFVDVIDGEVYENIVREIVAREDVNSIIEHLRNSMFKFDISFIRKLVLELISANTFRKILFLLTEQSLIQTELQTRAKILTNSLEGFSTGCTGTCYLCHEQDGLIMHYNNCGHDLHPSCGYDVKMCVVCGCKQQVMIERQINSLMKIKIEVYGLEIDLPQYSGDGNVIDRKQRQKEKLKKFDDDRIEHDYL